MRRYFTTRIIPRRERGRLDVQGSEKPPPPNVWWKAASEIVREISFAFRLCFFRPSADQSTDRGSERQRDADRFPRVCFYEPLGLVPSVLGALARLVHGLLALAADFFPGFAALLPGGVGDFVDSLFGLVPVFGE